MEPTRNTTRVHLRSLTSFVLTLSFLVALASGLVLYLAPPGGQARATGWTFWSLGRDGWMAQHLTACTVLLVASLVHVWLNLRVLAGYVYSKAAGALHRKWELALACVFALFMVVGTMRELPPWRYILAGSRHLAAYRKDAAAARGESHRGHGYRDQGGAKPRGKHKRGRMRPRQAQRDGATSRPSTP